MSKLHSLLTDICDWSVAATPVDPVHVDTSLDAVSAFRSDAGHSGAVLREAIVKTGDVAAIYGEVRYAQHLGAICPEIYGEWPGGYAMERLRQSTPAVDTLVLARASLEKLVWCREPAEPEQEWLQDFSTRFLYYAPDFSRDEKPCLIHGDPTLGNVVLTDGGVRILDPKPPARGIPSFRSVDLGKMLQSMLGWEQLRTGRRRPYRLDSPLVDLSDDELMRVAFWCTVHLRRIMQREPKESPTWLWAHERRHRLIYEVLP